MVTHEDIVVLISLVSAIGLLVLAFVGYLAWDVARMTRALAGLVYQEDEKTRALLR